MRPLFYEAVDDVSLLQALPLNGSLNQIIRKHRSEIGRQYEAYSQALRRPVRDLPIVEAALKDALHAKYSEGRSGKGVFSFIEERAERIPIRSCPYCGRGGVGTIDHYLPKEHFAWFSVYSKNLVPSCQECQNIKGSKIGMIRQGRPIHPLFDRIGYSQDLSVRTFFHASDLMLTTFEMNLIPNRNFSRKIRKREKLLFTYHWKFFGKSRADVTSSCRIALSDIRIDLLELSKTEDVADLSLVQRWVQKRMRRALKHEDRSSDTLLFIGLLRGLCADIYSLRQLLATNAPQKQLTRAAQGSLLRAR